MVYGNTEAQGPARGAGPGYPSGGTSVLSPTWRGFFLPGNHGLIEELSCFHNEYPGEFTLILSGSPVIPGDDTVAETVEKAGGSLIPANCTGLRVFPGGRGYTPGPWRLCTFEQQVRSQEAKRAVFEYIGETASGFPPMGYW